MEMIEQFLVSLSQQVPLVMLVLTILGSLVPLASLYVALTPNKEDDAWWKSLEENKWVGWALKFLQRFALIDRKGA